MAWSERPSNGATCDGEHTSGNSIPPVARMIREAVMERRRRTTSARADFPRGSFLAYHALLTLDYDLSGEFEPWEPPQPFGENTYAFPNRMFTKAELLGYIDYCRQRVRATLDALTEDVAARPLPAAHRYHGMLYGVIVGRMPLHVLEHASQIRQFLTATGVKVQPMPGVVATRGDP
jgi:hypothetical protein